MQTEALGWLIDDILLTTAVAPHDERHLAVSCKSNVQVTASGLPADFMTRCWQQWAKADTGPMHRGKDYLMLVTRILGDVERLEERGPRRGPRACPRPHACAALALQERIRRLLYGRGSPSAL
jgi:hypothetical protein